MECPHLGHRIGGRALLRKISTSNDFECSECKSKSTWICVQCGLIGCGRYANGHAKKHFEDKSNHSVCMDCTNFSVFCYVCDDYISNDTRSQDLAELRARLRSLRGLENLSNPASLTSRSRSRSTTTKSSTDDDEDKKDRKRKSSTPTLSTSKKKSKSRSDNNLSRIVSSSAAKKKTLPCQANVAGLRNLGNTCFMNAVLQSLSNIQQFSGYFKELPSLERKEMPRKGNNNSTFSSSLSVSSKKDLGMYGGSETSTVNNNPKPITIYSTWSGREIVIKDSNNGSNSIYTNPLNSIDSSEKTLLAEELRKTLLMLRNGSNKGAISPESLFAVIWKVVPRYRGYQQQDAHEFLRYMLDRLHSELHSILPSAAHISFGKVTIVTNIFGGILQNEVTCLACNNKSIKHDPFLDLSLDLPDDTSSTKSSDSEGNSNSSAPSTRGKIHLLDCLSSFIRLEELEETELYHCPNCKKRQRSTKRFWIRKLPNVLCLHLKRFRWNNYSRTKLDTFVEYPLTGLDMSQYVLSNRHETRRSGSGGTRYDLAAVVVHHGSGLGSGHYTAYATHGGCWHHFNDSNVSVCEDKTVANTHAYILFYIRRELNLLPSPID